jgi:streptomycin 6-kinase
VRSRGFPGKRGRRSRRKWSASLTSTPEPSTLDWLRASEEGRAWLDALPRLLAECTERWNLRLGRTFAGGYVSLPVAAELPDGTDVVLKIQFPHRESEHEAAALELWDGDGAVRLLAHDAERHAVLLER